MTSGGNNFNDFPENQLTIDFAFLCKPTRNATVSPFPLVKLSWCHFGERRSPKIFGERRFPRVPPRLHHRTRPNSIMAEYGVASGLTCYDPLNVPYIAGSADYEWTVSLALRTPPAPTVPGI